MDKKRESSDGNKGEETVIEMLLGGGDRKIEEGGVSKRSERHKQYHNNQLTGTSHPSWFASHWPFSSIVVQPQFSSKCSGFTTCQINHKLLATRSGLATHLIHHTIPPKEESNAAKGRK